MPRPARPAAARCEVVGLHVHHGLQPEADAWVRHLQAQARRWAARGLPVSLQWQRLQGAPAAGDSVEAWARRERYAALAEMARGCGAGIVLLAHHRRDQAETFLLQALRGAGPAGLAAMPREAQRDGIVWARPWLDAAARGHRRLCAAPSAGLRRRPQQCRPRAWRATACATSVWPALAHGFRARRGQPGRAAPRARRRPRPACASWRRSTCRCAGRPALHRADAGWRCRPRAARNLLRAWLARRRPAPVCPKAWCSACCANCPRQRMPARWPWRRRRAAAACRAAAGGARRGSPAVAPEPQRHRPEPGRALRRARLGRQLRGAARVDSGRPGAAAAAPLRAARAQRRRTLPARQRHAAAQPEEAVPGRRRARLAARRAACSTARSDLLFVPGLGVDARRQAAPAARRMLGLRWLPARPLRADG